MLALLNSHLDNVTLFFTIIVWVESMIACAINVWASHNAWPATSRVRIAVAVMSFLFVIGYAILIFTPFDPGLWSTVARGVGMVTWPVVYCWPAINSVVSLKNFELGLAAKLRENRQDDDESD